MKRVLLLIAVAAGLLAGGAANAHKASDSYLTLVPSQAELAGRWDIALRDLDLALDLDADGDGAITWGEVRSHEAAIAAYALARLNVRSDGESCALAASRLRIDHHSDGAYAVLDLAGRCPSASPALHVDYRLLFDRDPQHRGLLRLVRDDGETSTVLTAAAPSATVSTASSPLDQLRAYVHEGVWHIGSGFDHVLFLLSLLLPAVLMRGTGSTRTWVPVTTFRAAFWDVAKIVTAFTIAHSITLSLAALGLVTLPSRLVESAIALSVVLAALNNLFPVIASGRWIAAFGFGLVHGFGFASALADLGLPAGSLALSLFGFNAGVELGQLAIVAAFLPVAFLARSTSAYRRFALVGGSIAIAAVAATWLFERAFDVALLPA